MEYALEIKGLNKVFKDSGFKLNNLSLNVPKGSVVGLVGRNGTGKSTTIKTILNIMLKDSGTVRFFGEELTDENIEIKNRIGVVFDGLTFSDKFTPVMLERVFSDTYSTWERKSFFKYLVRFQIPKNKPLRTFSRGMLMKLAITVALSHKANLLILDEATAGLDPVVREEILDVFHEFVEDENNSILIASHISSDLEKIADYITFIDDGEVILTESKDSLIYEYGIARMKEEDFNRLNKGEYVTWRKRGLQTEVLISDRKVFSKNYPEIIVDSPTIDEILPMLVKEAV